MIGSDNLIKFHTWKKWKKIPDLAKIVVFARQNYAIKAINSVAVKKLKKTDWIYINSKSELYIKLEGYIYIFKP